MNRTALDQYIEPPPRLHTSAEALPHVGGLALHPYRGELPDEMESHMIEPLRDAFDAAAAEARLKQLLAQPKARERLARCRHVVIGISRRGAGSKGEALTYLVVAYDYNSNVAVEIASNAQGELIGVADAQYQPAPVQREIDRAIELARQDDRIAAKVVGMDGMAIPFAGPNNEWTDRRVIEVLFGCRGERLPRHRAWVDLSTDTVLRAGDECECCAGREGERS
jgi:hypothetical protein